jgi:hypothetical protein
MPARKQPVNKKAKPVKKATKRDAITKASLAAGRKTAKQKKRGPPAAKAAPKQTKLVARLRVVCTSPPQGKQLRFGLRDKKTKEIVTASSRDAKEGTQTWEFDVTAKYDASRTTDAQNPFPGRLVGRFVENGKGEWNVRPPASDCCKCQTLRCCAPRGPCASAGAFASRRRTRLAPMTCWCPLHAVPACLGHDCAFRRSKTSSPTCGSSPPRPRTLTSRV